MAASPCCPPLLCRHQLQQIARVLRDTDPQLYSKLQQLGAEDCMFAYRCGMVQGQPGWLTAWLADVALV